MRSDAELIRSILYYCGEIQNNITDVGNDIEDFIDSRMCQHACSFCIEQIGRNVKDLSKELTDRYNEVPWSEIAGMRDIIAHRYHRIIIDRIWATITENIPVLKESCEKILYELERS